MFLKFEVMNIDNLLSTFEQRLRLQRYSEASIRNYKSAVGSFLQLASKKYDKPEDLTAKEIEKYVYWLIEKKKNQCLVSTYGNSKH